VTDRVAMAALRERLRASGEIALIDVRDEADYAQAQIFGSVSMPLPILEDLAVDLLPRPSVPIVILDEEPGLASSAATVLLEMGYSDIRLTEGGLEVWKSAGGELFEDVNVPSKAFGEWVATHKHTPLMPPDELAARVRAGEDIVILDARPFDEYSTMSIPGGISAPGAELLLRAPAVVASERTHIVVNCAGRTRSIIGAQSLIDAGISNPVSALENGTIGWSLAGLELAKGAASVAPRLADEALAGARVMAAEVARRAGVVSIDGPALATMISYLDRTTYAFDVRTPDEYRAFHAAGFASAPGGQLVQALDEFVAVRNARILIVDHDGVRAPMTAAWLRQIGQADTFIVPFDEMAAGAWQQPPCAAAAIAPGVPLDEARKRLSEGAVVLDLTISRLYEAQHLPGAWFLSRARIEQDAHRLPASSDFLVTSPRGKAACACLAALKSLLPHARIEALAGGTQAWIEAELPTDNAARSCNAASPLNDSYKRPYLGTNNSREAMRNYIDWELQLVDQVERDGIAGFSLI